MNPRISKGLLIHASREADLSSLKPLTASEGGAAIFATCCEIYATSHVLRCKYGYDIRLHQYRILGINLTVCLIHATVFDQVLDSEITHYFVDSEPFMKRARRVGLIERFTIGLLKNTNVEYSADISITPVDKVTLTLKDVLRGGFLRIQKYHVYVGFT